jgi:hypothetical protein
MEVKNSDTSLVDIVNCKFYVMPAKFKKISLLHKYFVIRNFPLSISVSNRLSRFKLPCLPVDPLYFYIPIFPLTSYTIFYKSTQQFAFFSIKSRVASVIYLFGDMLFCILHCCKVHFIFIVFCQRRSF